MSVNIDLTIAELISSRICHDLVSPVNSINMGLELLSETQDSFGTMPEVMYKSVRQAAAYLSMYRIALGLYGGGGGNVTFKEIQGFVANYYEDKNNITIQWQIGNLQTGGELEIPKDAAKMLLNIIMLASDCLPRGGVITIVLANINEGLGIAVAAEGDNVRINDDIALAIRPDVKLNDITARNVQAYFVYRLAEAMNTSIETKILEGQRLEVATCVAYNNV